MKIEDKRGTGDVVFTSLNNGSTFVSGKGLYLKIEPFVACNGEIMNAVHLEENFATHFDPADVVRIVSCKVIIENRR